MAIVECEHKEDDIAFLKEKVEAGCDFLTTQMFFDNNVYYNFLYRVLAVGISGAGDPWHYACYQCQTGQAQLQSSLVPLFLPALRRLPISFLMTP